MKIKNFQSFTGQNDHMQAKQHFRTAAFQEFIRQLCFFYHLLENTSRQESSIRLRVCEEQQFYRYIRSKYGHPTPVHERRIDMVAHVAPQNNSVKKDTCLTVGFEIKTHVMDLLRDTKYLDYSEAVNLFFLAVTKNLLEEALAKVDEHKQVGVYCLDDGQVYRWPEYRIPCSELIEQLRRDALFRVAGVSVVKELPGRSYSH